MKDFRMELIKIGKIINPDFAAHKRKRYLKYIKPGSEVLDVGCGNGYFSFLTYKNRSKVLGIDHDGNAIKKNKFFAKSMGYNIDFEELDVKELNRIDRKFDYIICFEVLEHVLDDEKIIWSFSKLLKKDGKLLVTVPNKRISLLFDKVSKIENGGHVRKGYSFNELKEKLSRMGFKVVKKDSCVGRFTRYVIEINRLISKKINDRYIKTLCFIILYPFTFLDVILGSENYTLFVLATLASSNKDI